MGKSVRKYRKNRDYEGLESAPEKKSAYAHTDGRGTAHTGGRTDLLNSPRAFLALDELAPGESSPLSVVMLLVLGSVGATVVAMPYAMLQGGFGMTIFLILAFGLLSCYTSTRLVQLGVTHGVYSIHALARLAFGARGVYVASLLQGTVSSGLMVAYLHILFKDTPVVVGRALGFDFDARGRLISSDSLLSKLLANPIAFDEVATTWIVIPACLFIRSYRRLDTLAVLTVALLLFACLSVLGRAKGLHEANVSTASQGYNRDYLQVPSTMFQTVGILATCFNNQHHALHAFYAMRSRSVDLFARVSLFAMMLSLFLALSFGIGGYVSFLKFTKQDLLENYSLNSAQAPTRIHWLFMPLCALLCIPAEVIASRHTVQVLCHPRTHSSETQSDVLFRDQAPKPYQSTSAVGEDGAVLPSPAHKAEDDACSWREQLATAGAVFALAQIATFVKTDIASVLSVTGGIAGISLALVLPAACQLRLALLEDFPQPPGASLVPRLCILLGVFSTAACLITLWVHGPS